MKNKTCKHRGCNEPCAKKPGNNIFYFDQCISHVVQSAMKISKATKKKAKIDLFKLNKTTFYQSAAWTNFRKYVLLFYANDDLEVRCSTNPRLVYTLPDRRIHVGHWIKVFDANSTNFSTALNFFNVAPQSHQENRYNSGNMAAMEAFLRKTHGDEAIDELLQIKNQPLRLDKYELDRISKIYLQKRRDLVLARGLIDPYGY